jgi:hypothetical protein
MARLTDFHRQQATTVAAIAPSVLPALAPAGGNQAAVVEVPDDDVPPPGWGQWESLPAPAPEPPVGVLVMREDDRVMSGHPTHSAESRRPTPPLRQAAPQRVRSRKRGASTRHRPTSAKPRPSRRCGRNSATTAPRSTGR